MQTARFASNYCGGACAGSDVGVRTLSRFLTVRNYCSKVKVKCVLCCVDVARKKKDERKNNNNKFATDDTYYHLSTLP